jgi:uncharacterized membrane protein YqiK
MSKVLNLEILGHPVNVLIILVILALWWFGGFTVFKRAFSGMSPANDSK